jgi:7-dehydrocholesterol reductase
MPELLFHDFAERRLIESPGISYRNVKRSLSVSFPGGDLPARRESHHGINWGRAHTPTWSASLSCLGIVMLSPLLVIVSWITLSQFQGSLLDSSIAMCTEGPWQFVARYGPAPSFKTSAVYASWVLIQAVLYNYLPSRLSTGQLTPAGYLLKYHTNGLSAWAVTHIAIGYGIFLGFIDPAWVAKNWAGLLVAVNSYGLLLSVFVYIKAYIAPTHAKDRKFSGRQSCLSF